jgi:hypothetical protein
MRESIGIAGLIVVAMVLVMVPGASAFAVDTVGTIQFENGTTCPYGWTVCEENLNETYGAEPWCEPSSYNPPFWDYLVVGQAETGESYIRVTVTSPDGKWYGENISKIVDVKDEMTGFYWVNLVVHEQELPTETFTKDLVTGWNLVSLPLMPDDNSTSVVLGSIQYDAVKSYNAATHQFEDVATMDPGVGYFIHMTGAGTWSYEGQPYNSMSVSLSQGLNMVGWTSTNASLPGALSQIAGNYHYVARWNATAQSYEVYLPGAHEVFNDFDTMDRGEGYFIAAKGSCTLTYP